MADQNRRYSIRFSGVGSDSAHSGRMRVSYCYASSKPLSALDNGKVGYSAVFPNLLEDAGSAFMADYAVDDDFVMSPYQGLASASSATSVSEFSVYRREYGVYERPGQKIRGYYRDGSFYRDEEYSSLMESPSPSFMYVDIPTNLVYSYSNGVYSLIQEAARVYEGDWEPVAVKIRDTSFRDFNVTAGRTYQYILYYSSATDGMTPQSFANWDSPCWVENASYPGQGRLESGSSETLHLRGAPVCVDWGEWSVMELEPLDDSPDTPTVERMYKANMDQLWLFRYSLETGAQTQNVSRSEFQTLGKFPKVGYGAADYVSGDVTALLGSEIVPTSRQSYVERLRGARLAPLSTNEKAKMLAQWRAFVSSKNPKLLRDMKGQSWIVQIFSSSNTPKNSYRNQPDTISFSWKQIADPRKCTIVGPVGDREAVEAEHAAEWIPVFGKMG